MYLIEKAKSEIQISTPYFELISNPYLSKKLRILLIEEAPLQFFSCLTQISRHICNGTLEIECKKFCNTFKSALLSLSNPETNIHEKRLILKEEPSAFLRILYKCFLENVLS